MCLLCQPLAGKYFARGRAAFAAQAGTPPMAELAVGFTGHGPTQQPLPVTALWWEGEGLMPTACCLAFTLNHSRYTRVYPPESVKFTCTWVSTSTGSPFSRYGLYFHCFTASIAAGASIGCPLINCRFSMLPSLLIWA